MTSRGVYIHQLLEDHPAGNVKSYMPNTACFLVGMALMIEVQMCTNHAVHTGNESSEDRDRREI